MEENAQNLYPYFIRLVAGVVLSIALIIFVLYKLTISSPTDFPQNRYIRIEKGLSIDETGDLLKERNVIRSTRMFRIFVALFGTTKNIIAGEYIFSEPESLYSVVKDVTDTEFKGRAIRVTIPEGFTNKDIANLLDGKLPDFDKSNFMKIALLKEGSLFPDTYIFPITYDEEKVVNKMFDNFQTKIEDIKPEIIASVRTRKEIIIMASILEKEARTLATKRKIAGILWKRLDKGMLLQVDASFLYLLNKQSSELTGADLNMDSPYNTYKYKGLPPGAISNPGMESIIASLRPEESPYFFYLSDDEGEMHYAVTFEDHKRNKQLYLR